VSDRIDPDRRALLAGAGAVLVTLSGCLSNPFEPGATAADAEDESVTDSGTADASGDAQTDPTDGSTGDSEDGTSEDPDGGTAENYDDGTETPAKPDLVVEVAAEKFRFTPEQFEIDVGSTVKWVWRDGGHNVRPDSIPGESDWSGTEGGDGTTYDEGHELVSTFETPGEYSYYCAPHRSLGLRGSFTVREE